MLTSPVQIKSYVHYLARNAVMRMNITIVYIVRTVGSKFSLVRPSACDGRNCDQMAAQAATGKGNVPPPAEVIAKYALENAKK